jgi:Tol biopolymer transport system component
VRRALWLAAALLAGCASDPVLFAPGVASTEYSDVRLTISPDGRTALWFSRNRPGGAGGYDIWLTRRGAKGWAEAQPVSFNTPAREFDPAFSADGRFVYFCSDRPGGLGGDDLWRVPVTTTGFGEAEHLGAGVNSAKNEWAPMLSPDGGTLLLASDGFAGAGRMDLFVSRVLDGVFSKAVGVPGDLNTAADEFDATFLPDGRSIVFARAANIEVDDVYVFLSVERQGRYSRGEKLPEQVNTAGSDTYAPMLDWSRSHSLTFSTKRPADSTRAADLYVVKYRP